ncbi:hypothetical protein OIU77_016718 [Salix suchowensis]|uniref:Uncharacterized protein n=1 Tax=Salix suchowensis TaxID=1278906 RepID=A0ABQ8ZLC6_9ROSI|nr:hypothetical protein OIU77_016718 [Salix suchowensis]
MLDCFEAVQERGFEVLSSGVMDEGRACNCCVGFCFLGALNQSMIFSTSECSRDLYQLMNNQISRDTTPISIRHLTNTSKKGLHQGRGGSQRSRSTWQKGSQAKQYPHLCN